MEHERTACARMGSGRADINESGWAWAGERSPATWKGVERGAQTYVWTASRSHRSKHTGGCTQAPGTQIAFHDLN